VDSLNLTEALSLIDFYQSVVFQERVANKNIYIVSFTIFPRNINLLSLSFSCIFVMFNILFGHSVWDRNPSRKIYVASRFGKV